MSTAEPITESDLVQRSLSGDRYAFEEIVRRHLSAVSATAYAVTGDINTSEDVAQETFLIAWQRLAQLEQKEKLRAWLCTIARNISRSIRKKHGHDALHHAGQLEEHRLVSAAPAADEKAIRAEQEQIVWQAIRQIPEDYRLPLVLYYRENQSSRQVAAALDLTEEAVRQRISRARAMLRREVSELVNSTLQAGRPSPLLAGAIVGAIGATASHASAGVVAAGAAKAGTGLSAAGSAALAGVILGPLLGIAGGIYGSWASIKSAKTEAERKILVRAMWQTVALVVIWLGVLGTSIYLGAAGYISPKSALITGAVNLAIYVILLVYLIGRTNRAIAAVTSCKLTSSPPARGNAHFVAQAIQNPRQFKLNMLGAFGGGIFGSLAWLLSASALAPSWGLFFTTLTFGIVLMALALRHTGKNPAAYWLNSTRAIVAIMCYVVFALWLYWSPALEQVFLHQHQMYGMSPTSQILLAFIIYLVLAAVSYTMHTKGKHAPASNSN